jgi:uncharacterized protein
MRNEGERFVPVPREHLWRVLNDAECLRQAIPGCVALERVGDDELTAQVKFEIGPIRASFGCRMHLQDIDAPRGYRLKGAGNGGPAGLAQGEAAIRLEEHDGGTLLQYTVEVRLAGKLAQLGARLIDGVAKKFAGQFFDRIAELAQQDEGATRSGATAAPETGHA